MDDQGFLVKMHEERYRDSADKILFDINKTNWNPSNNNLENFCKRTYTDIVNKYQELEKTREYVETGEVLFAKGSQSNSRLAFTVGFGSTISEASATHALGWELKRLLDSRRESIEPFDFKLLVVGYRGPSGDDGEYVPLDLIEKLFEKEAA